MSRRSKRKTPKTLMNEKLPDPKAASAELSQGDPRGRTAAHLKRILTAGLSLPLAAGVASSTAMGYQVVDPVPPPAVVQQPFGTLRVKSLMTVGIDGRTPQVLQSESTVSVLAGLHTIQLTNSSSSGTFVIEIGIQSNPARPVVNQLIPSGVLKTLSAADIKIDGMPAKRITPQDSVDLSAGNHTIEISPAPVSSTHSFTLEIRVATPNPPNRGR